MTQVRISVTQISSQIMGKPHQGRPRPGRVLVDVIDDDAVAAEHAIAWATARCYHQLVGALGRMFSQPPDNGFAVIINRTHALLVFAAWPWFKQRHIIDGQPSTEWPEHL